MIDYCTSHEMSYTLLYYTNKLNLLNYMVTHIYKI